jgi:hypothetical protein
MSAKNGRPKKPDNGKPKPGRKLVFLAKLTGEETDEELEQLAERMAAVMSAEIRRTEKRNRGK